MRKLYNHVFVALLAVLAGVAVSHKLGETAGDLRQLTSEVSRQLSRSGYGMITSGENFTARLRRVGTTTAPARPCRSSAATRG
ncbi:MAG TPA: hypothetical protein VK421_06640 [Pyrinomonadaceae bacterium]|nr:hypothetical protein [Pyrinomonadaceae bacterium]